MIPSGAYKNVKALYGFKFFALISTRQKMCSGVQTQN